MDLSKFDAQFGSADVKSNSQIELPEGKFRMKVSNCELFESKESQRPFFKIELTVVEGDHKGVEITKLYSLDTPERFPYLKGDLATCGLLLTKLSDLQGNMAKIKGVTVNVQCKHKDNYVNYYINGRFSATEAAPGSDPKVPF
jgi:hypothetical protein